MRLFGKRKKESEDDLEKEQGKKQRVSRRRKTPPKPWGKKERLFLLSILIVTVSASAILALSSRAWKLPGIPRFKPPIINLPFMGEETIIIEGDKDKLKAAKKSEEIIANFKERTNELSGIYGLYIIDLKSGYRYGVNESESFEPASLNKLPVMAALYMEAEKNGVDLETKYQLEDTDKLGGAGTLRTKPEGYEITYRNLIRLMGKQSDNTAFNIVKNFLGQEKIEQAILKIGMKNTSLTDNATTPEDIGIFFDELFHGNMLENKHKDELLEYLTNTVYEEWVTEGVPGEVRVAHKYGRETHVVNDGGIVYAKDPYVVVILSKGVVEREADKEIPEFSKIIFNTMSSNLQD